jgi:putative thioredoxin
METLQFTDSPRFENIPPNSIARPVFMASKDHVLEGTAQNFNQLVLENSQRGLVLVDFWSPKAGPSLRQREMLLRLAGQMAGRFLLVSVNTDLERKLSREYGVHSLPSFKLFRHGRVVEEVRGVQPEADYRRIVERHLGSTDPVQQAAMRTWQSGEQEQALQILAEGAVAAPDNPALPLTMAKLLMQSGRQRDAHEILQAVPATLAEHPEIARLRAHLDFIVTAAEAPPREELEQRPEDPASRYQLAALNLVQDNIDQTLRLLLDLARDAPDYRGGIARKGLKALLTTLGDSNPQVREIRQELAKLTH